MASKVYFANLRARNPRENKANKVQRLFEAAGFEDLIKEGDLTAIKLHAAHPALKDGGFVTLRVTEVINITPDCDCLPWSDSSIVPDIGILASQQILWPWTQPPTISSKRLKASKSLHSRAILNRARISSKGVWERVDETCQIRYSEKIGLGDSRYELIEI